MEWKLLRTLTVSGAESRCGHPSAERTLAVAACTLLAIVSVGFCQEAVETTPVAGGAAQTGQIPWTGEQAGASPESVQQASDVAMAAAVLSGYRVAYIDQDGLLRTVNEDGTDDKVLVNTPVGRFNAADPGRGGVIVTLAYNDLYWQIFNYTEDGRRIALATSKYKNVFMAYDPVYRRVYYAKNYDEQLKKGDFYSVPLTGGASTLLAKNAIWGDVIGDRLVFLQEWPGNKNIYSIRYDGTGFVGLATSTADETYVGKRSKLVIFTRLYNGSFTNLYAIPVSGGSQITLDTTPANKTFAGNGTERIYYYREYPDGREVCSILPTGAGRVNLTSFRWDHWAFAGEGVDRVGLFLTWWPTTPHSVTKSGTSPIALPFFGRNEHLQPTVFYNRMVYQYGGEHAWTTTSVSLASQDQVDLVSDGRNVTQLSWPAKRIIVDLQEGGLFAFDAQGRNKVQLGGTHSNPDFLFSTPYRHVFAYFAYADPDNVEYFNVSSVRLDGKDERVVARDLPAGNLSTIVSYYLNPPSR